jgi:hypothetical protein
MRPHLNPPLRGEEINRLDSPSTLPLGYGLEAECLMVVSPTISFMTMSLLNHDRSQYYGPGQAQCGVRMIKDNMVWGPSDGRCINCPRLPPVRFLSYS